LHNLPYNFLIKYKVSHAHRSKLLELGIDVTHIAWTIGGQRRHIEEVEGENVPLGPLATWEDGDANLLIDEEASLDREL
jgi:hypothetical protein